MRPPHRTGLSAALAAGIVLGLAIPGAFEGVAHAEGKVVPSDATAIPMPPPTPPARPPELGASGAAEPALTAPPVPP